MWKLIKNSIKVGIQTEKFSLKEDQIELIGPPLALAIAKRFNRALSIRMVDAGSCNACELEINAMNNPYYNIEQFNIHFVASPRHADLLLVTGPVTLNMREALVRTYEAMPNPKCVVAVGDCAKCGGIFNHSYAVVGAVSHVIPVNVVVSGCPPTPVDIMNGLLKAVQI